MAEAEGYFGRNLLICTLPSLPIILYEYIGEDYPAIFVFKNMATDGIKPRFLKTRLKLFI